MGVGGRRAALTVLAILAGTVGCGGGGDEGAGPTTTASEATTTSAGPGTTAGPVYATTTTEPAGELPEGVEPTDLLTFAQGAMPVAFEVEGPGDPIGSSAVLEVVDGNPVPRILVSGATDETAVRMTFELPADTTFDRFAVPRVEEGPSASVTFVREVLVEGGTEGPAGAFVELASGTLVASRDRAAVVELDVAASPAVRFVRVTLRGGLDVQDASSDLQFSEIVGNGTQEQPELLEAFTGMWDVRLADVDRSAGVLELVQAGPVVTGCFDDADVTGTVTGNVVRLAGIDRSDGTASAYIFGPAADGTLHGTISSNGGPFAYHRSVVAPPGTTTPCSPPPEAPPPPPPTIGCGSVVHGITFDVSSDVIRPDAAPVLEELFAGLQGAGGVSIVVEGHTSTEGSDAYNQDLSERRARAVVEDLVLRGLDAASISSAGFGETRPLISPDDDEAARSINRRVEIACA